MPFARRCASRQALTVCLFFCLLFSTCLFVGWLVGWFIILTSLHVCFICWLIPLYMFLCWFVGLFVYYSHISTCLLFYLFYSLGAGRATTERTRHLLFIFVSLYHYFYLFYSFSFFTNRCWPGHDRTYKAIIIDICFIISYFFLRTRTGAGRATTESTRH